MHIILPFAFFLIITIIIICIFRFVLVGAMMRWCAIHMDMSFNIRKPAQNDIRDIFFIKYIVIHNVDDVRFAWMSMILATNTWLTEIDELFGSISIDQVHLKVVNQIYDCVQFICFRVIVRLRVKQCFLTNPR